MVRLSQTCNLRGTGLFRIGILQTLYQGASTRGGALRIQLAQGTTQKGQVRTSPMIRSAGWRARDSLRSGKRKLGEACSLMEVWNCLRISGAALPAASPGLAADEAR